MVNRNLIRVLDVSEDDWQSELDAALAGSELDDHYMSGTADVLVNQIVEGRVLRAGVHLQLCCTKKPNLKKI